MVKREIPFMAMGGNQWIARMHACIYLHEVYLEREGRLLPLTFAFPAGGSKNDCIVVILNSLLKGLEPLNSLICEGVFED